MNKILNIIRKKKNILNIMKDNKKMHLRDLPRVRAYIVINGKRTNKILCEGYLFKVLPSITGDYNKINTKMCALIINDDNTTLTTDFYNIEFIN